MNILILILMTSILVSTLIGWVLTILDISTSSTVDHQRLITSKKMLLVYIIPGGFLMFSLNKMFDTYKQLK